MKIDIESPVALARIVVIGLLVASFQAPAIAAELDCGELAGRLKTGDDYRLHLDLQSQKVLLEFGDDSCAETAKIWFDRQIILPQPAKRGISLPATALEAPRGEITVKLKSDIGNGDLPLPGQIMRQGALPDLGLNSMGRETAALPIQRASDQAKEQKPEVSGAAVADKPDMGQPETPGQAADAVSGVRISNDPEGGAAKVTKYQADFQKSDLPSADGTAPPPATGKAPNGDVPVPADKPEEKPVHRCDRELTDYWQAGEHKIKDRMVNLAGVFTVDLNNDGRVDNVGFKIGKSGRIGNVLGYFPAAKGRLSARAIPTLKLDDDDDIHRLCAGDVTFTKMTLDDKRKAVGSAKRRQTELMAVAKPSSESAKAEIEKTKADPATESIPDMTAQEKTDKLLFWAITVATVLFVLGGIGLFFAIRNMRSNDDEEEDEDEDDDDES